MDKLRQLLTDYINNKEVILCATVSNPRNREKIQRLRIRPVLKKEELLYQSERLIGTKAYHQNLHPDAIPDLLIMSLAKDFKQLEVETERHKLTVLVSKKGKQTIKERQKNVRGTGKESAKRFFTQQTKTIYSPPKSTSAFSDSTRCTDARRNDNKSKI